MGQAKEEGAVPVPELCCATSDEHLLPYPWHHHTHTSNRLKKLDSRDMGPASLLHNLYHYLVNAQGTLNKFVHDS